MPYAALSDVQARAGGVRDAWTSASKPSTEEIEGFLVDTAGMIDAAVAARGLSVPVVDAGAAAALRGLNADGALVLALEATPGSAPTSMLEGARERWRLGLASLLDGTHPAVAALESGQTAAGLSAGSLWTDEPEYDPVLEFTNRNLDPVLSRGMSL